MTVLVLSDFDSEYCGVGSSAAAWASSSLPSFETLDPVHGPMRMWLSVIARARSTDRRAVVVYPTLSSRCHPRLLASLALLRVAGFSIAFHLHEFSRLHPVHRAYVRLLLLLTTGPIVVSTLTEQRYVESRLRGLGLRRLIAVCPPANGAAPTDPPRPGELRSDGDGIVVGVFGIARRDKGLQLLPSVLSRLERPVKRIQLVGSGWVDNELLPRLRTQYMVDVFGHVPTEALGNTLARWDLAIALFSDGPTDGRMSLRTTLAYAVPTVTTLPLSEADLTLSPPHLILADPERDRIPVPVPAKDSEPAREVADFETAVRDRLTELLTPQSVNTECSPDHHWVSDVGLERLEDGSSLDSEGR